MNKLVCLLMFASLPAWADDFSGAWKVDGLIADHTIARNLHAEAGGRARSPEAVKWTPIRF